jgi:hypothetical protein
MELLEEVPGDRVSEESVWAADALLASAAYAGPGSMTLVITSETTVRQMMSCRIMLDARAGARSVWAKAILIIRWVDRRMIPPPSIKQAGPLKQQVTLVPWDGVL